jgi:phosphate/sulfate permease
VRGLGLLLLVLVVVAAAACSVAVSCVFALLLGMSLGSCSALGGVGEQITHMRSQPTMPAQSLTPFVRAVCR